MKKFSLISASLLKHLLINILGKDYKAAIELVLHIYTSTLNKKISIIFTFSLRVFSNDYFKSLQDVSKLCLQSALFTQGID